MKLLYPFASVDGRINSKRLWGGDIILLLFGVDFFSSKKIFFDMNKSLKNCIQYKDIPIKILN